jgi:hypothetical protein
MKKITLLPVLFFLASCASIPSNYIYKPTLLEIGLLACIFTLYFVALITIALLTFRKGYTFLGCLGIFFPLLWLIGAILPPKPGSTAWKEESLRQQAGREHSG